MTVRKGNKKLAIYDLTLVLSWVGRWEIDGKEVLPAVRFNQLGRPSVVICGDIGSGGVRAKGRSWSVVCWERLGG